MTTYMGCTCKHWVYRVVIGLPLFKFDVLYWLVCRCFMLKHLIGPSLLGVEALIGPVTFWSRGIDWPLAASSSRSG